MADTVEISNVGGYRGVASEATLLALVDSIRKQGLGGAGASDRSIARLQELHNRSIREGTTEVKAFDKAIEKAADATKDFTKELLVGGDRISDFADAILGSQNVLARFIGFVQGTFDQFRNLASVGATFNNSFLEMITTSSEASMTIDGFTEMVRNNSQALSRFGGTVTNGAQYFARFSRDFRLGIGQRFFEMGFTIADINEGLIGFLEMERMRSSRQLRSDAELQAGAANYLLQLDRLAKITGRQRRELEEVMQRQLQDAGIRAQMNRLDGKARENFRDVLTFIQTELPGLSDGLVDLMDGVAQTDPGRALQSLLPGLVGDMQAAFAGGVSLEEFIGSLSERYGPRLDALASSMSAQQLQAMRLAGGIQGAIAEIIDAGHEVNTATSRDAREARAEQAAQAGMLQKTFGRFEQAIIEIRKFLFNELINSPFAAELGEIGDEIVKLFEGRAPGSFPGIIGTLKNSFDILFGGSGILTRAIRWFSNWIREGGIQEAFTSLETTINEFVERFTANMEAKGFWRAIGIEIERLINNLFGSVDEESGQRQGGLMNLILNKMEELFDGAIALIQPRIDSFLQSVGLPPTTAGGQTLWAAIKERVGLDGNEPLLPQIGRMIEDFLFGEISSIEFRDGEEIETREGGLIKTISDGFSNMLSGNSPIVDSIRDSFESMFRIAEQALLNVIGVEQGQTLGQWFRTTFTDVSTRFDEIMATVNQTLENFKTAIGFGNGTSLTEWFDTTWASVSETMNGISSSITSAVDLIRQAFNLGSGGSLGDWITNTLAELGAWKDSQIASLKSFVGMEGEESFGAFVTRTINEIQTGIQTQIDNTIASLKSFVGMEGEESFGTFVTRTINEIQTGIQTQINETIASLKGFVGMEGEESFGAFVTRTISEIQTGIQTQIDNTIASLKSFVGMEGEESFGDFVTRTIREIQTGIETQINDTLDLIDNKLRTFLGMSEGQTFESYISNMITTLTNTILDIFENRIPALINSAIRSAQSAVRDRVSGVDQSGVLDALEGEGITTAEAARELIADLQGSGLMNPGEVGYFNVDEQLGQDLYERLYRAAGLNSVLDRGLTSGGTVNLALERLSRQAEEGTITDESLQILTDVGRILKNVEGYSTGTNGFQHFGRGTLSMLHGAEAVVPRNTPAGELLQAFFDMQSGLQSQTTQTPTPIQPSYNQSELASKIDQLNSIMIQVAEILTDQKDIQTRTMRSLRGMGTDLFKGAA